MKMREGRMKWYEHVEERPGVYKKGDGNGVTRKEKKREAKEKISGCSEGVYAGKLVQEKRTLKTGHCGGTSYTVATPD